MKGDTLKDVIERWRNSDGFASCAESECFDDVYRLAALYIRLLDDKSIHQPKPEGDERYLALLKEMAELHAKKSADYGRGEDPLANVRASTEIGLPAWKGAFLRALDKVNRIKSFCLNGKLENEGVEDSFKDLAAYALIALVLFREEQLIAEVGDPH